MRQIPDPRIATTDLAVKHLLSIMVMNQPGEWMSLLDLRQLAEWPERTKGEVGMNSAINAAVLRGLVEFQDGWSTTKNRPARVRLRFIPPASPAKEHT